MEKIIKVTTNRTVLQHEEVTVNLPETSKFFFKNDNGNFFPLGFVLFAIIPRYESNPTSNYMLYKVYKGNQKSTDFVPTKDCRQESFLDESIRREAFNILRGRESWEWQEVTEDAFLTIRADLLSIENLTCV